MEQIKSKKKITGVIDSEMIGEGKSRFFVDLKKARNNKPYLSITRSEPVEENIYRRSNLVIFEEDMAFFAEAVMMVLTRMAHGESGMVN